VPKPICWHNANHYKQCSTMLYYRYCFRFLVFEFHLIVLQTNIYSVTNLCYLHTSKYVWIMSIAHFVGDCRLKPKHWQCYRPMMICRMVCCMSVVCSLTLFCVVVDDNVDKLAHIVKEIEMKCDVSETRATTVLCFVKI
jgi:hypothetical protein